MEVPEVPSEILFSADGVTWQAIGAKPVGSSTSQIAGLFARAGIYVGATSLPAPAVKKGPGNASTIAAVLILVAIALGLALGPVAWRRARRSPQPASPKGSRRTPTRPGPRGGKRRR